MTGNQVIYDNSGRYFTITDKFGNNLSPSGQIIPHNVPNINPSGGASMSGIKKPIYNSISHYKDID